MIKSKKTLENIKPYSIDNYYQEFEMKLDSNENPYGPSPLVIRTLRNFEPDKVKFYPAYGNLTDRLAGFVGAKPENFILTNGCDEAINVILNTFLEKGDRVLTFAPTFSMPKLYCEVIGAEFAEIPYKTKFRFDYEVFSSNITEKTKILYLTSPNNPTGELIPSETVKRLLIENQNRLVVLDCTYFNYSEISRNEYYKLVEEFDNLAIVKSFSKDYALAGLRLGYIFANEAVINEARKVISPYSVNSAALHAGLAALLDVNYFLDIKRKISLSKEKLSAALNSYGYKVYNTEANFILCDFGSRADFVYNKLLNNGVKVKYFKGIEALENMFRITVPELEKVDFLINLLKPRPLFVFDLDGVVFDVKNSYRLAIKKTFEHFTGYECSDSDMQAAKNLGGLSNDWDLTAYLIKKAGKKADYNELINVFQDLFFKPEREGSKGLIDNEEPVFRQEFFEHLTGFADCAVFTGRPKDEAFYSLEKFGIKKYFSYFVCNEDVEGNHKPSPYGLNKIKSSTPHTSIYYFGDTVDDIKAGVDAGVRVFGIIPPNASNPEATKQRLTETGADSVFENPVEILMSNAVKESDLCR